jgi:integrase
VALWKRGKRYWTDFTIEAGDRFRLPLCPPGKKRGTTNWQEATRLEKQLIEAAMKGHIDAKAGPTRLEEACTAFLAAKLATGDSERNIEFLTERLAVVRKHFGDIKLTAFTREMIEGYQAKRKLAGASNRTINMDLGALRQVLKRYRVWRRLEADVKFLTENGGSTVGRALTNEEQHRLFEAAQGNHEWEHVYCAATLAANTSMSGVEIKHLRRCHVDVNTAEVDVTKSKGGRAERGRRRNLPLNGSALKAVQIMLARMDTLGHTDPQHYIWCASQHHKFDPTKPAKKWDSAWRALRTAAGLPGLRFHDLRHTVITQLLEAGEPGHVVESITGHLSKRMLQHYSHIRKAAKRGALDRLDESRKAHSA